MKEGFGVLTEIDVAATLKQKIGKAMPAYRILGACNPSLAGRAIDLEPQIGALLPCNVVVRVDAQGAARVEFMDPRTVLGLVDRPGIEDVDTAPRNRHGGRRSRRRTESQRNHDVGDRRAHADDPGRSV